MTKSSTHFTLILKKNKKVLTLVSAGIVLFSFFLKEALSESLKDNLQAAKALIGQYEHFDDDYPARRQFSQIVDKLDVLTDAVIAGHKQTKLEEQIALIHKRLVIYELDVLRVLRKTTLISETSPRKEQLSTKMTEIENRRMNIDSPGEYKSLPQNDETIKQLTSDLEAEQKLYHDTKVIEFEARADLYEGRDRLEHLLKVVSGVTYVLFGLGWGLGLFYNLEVVDVPKVG